MDGGRKGEREKEMEKEGWRQPCICPSSFKTQQPSQMWLTQHGLLVRASSTSGVWVEGPSSGLSPQPMEHEDRKGL